MTDDVFGFGSDDVSRIREAVSFVEKNPRYTLKERRWKGPPPTTGCDCCPPCCATLFNVVGDEIIWTADFYKDVSQAELDTWYVGGVMPIAGSCDSDSNGNVYQCGFRSAKLQTNLSRPQPAMWS